MSSKPGGMQQGLERALSLEIARVTERAAVAAARLRGRGAEKKSDQAAVDAMRRELSMLADRRHGRHRRRRDGRGADAVHRREGRHQARPEGRYRRRSAGRHDAVRQEHARRHRDAGDGRARHAPARARYLHGQDRDRPRLSEWRRRSRRAGRRQYPQARQGQGRQAGGDHRDDPRSAAARRPDRRGAQGRRRR